MNRLDEEHSASVSWWEFTVWEEICDKAVDNAFLNVGSGVCLVEQVINKIWLLIFKTLLTSRTIFRMWKCSSMWPIKVEVNHSLLTVIGNAASCCPGFNWDRGNFPLRRWCSAVVLSHVDSTIDNILIFQLLLSRAYPKSRIFSFPWSASEELHKKLGGSMVRTADPDWPRGYSIP